MARTDDIIERYAAAFASLTPATMDEILAMLSPEARFTDPFNDVTGHAGFKAIFAHMFETCEAPRFHIIDIAHGTHDGGRRAYLRWRMSGHLKGWPHTNLDLEGMSEVRVGDDGLISAHIDHWDSASQLLARLPLIGTLLRPVLRLFRVRTGGS
ncbi:MAG: nuclear transport factor 2 family protein [Candidatus Puniceispirillaceae bacterium]